MTPINYRQGLPMDDKIEAWRHGCCGWCCKRSLRGQRRSAGTVEATSLSATTSAQRQKGLW